MNASVVAQPYTAAQRYAARELKTIFETRAVLTFVCTKVRLDRDHVSVIRQSAFILAMDHGAIINVSGYVASLLGLPFDEYLMDTALRLGKVSPQDVCGQLGTMLYLDEEKIRAEVIS